MSLDNRESSGNSQNRSETTQSANWNSEHQKHIKDFLEELRNGQKPVEPSGDNENASDVALNGLNYKDFPALRRAHAKLHVASKDKKLDLTFWSCIMAMVGTLNLYLDPELTYTWHEASLVIAKSLGMGVKNDSKHACSIHTWIHCFLATRKLPCHHHGQYSVSILDHEDFTHNIQLHLMEMAKDSYICAQDVVDYVATPAMQQKLGSKARGISLQTARRWLKKLDWRYGWKKKGMYIDEHEREDVVKYCNEFLARWKEYEKRMVTYDNDGNIEHEPAGFPVPQGGHFWLILITHDESTFYTNGRRKTQWNHAMDKATPQCKGEGPSLIISDMMTAEWGRLYHDGK